MDRQILESMVCDAVERGIITAKMVVGMYPPTVAVGILDGRGRPLCRRAGGGSRPLEADLYKRTKQAEAARIERQNESDAALYSAQKDAEGIKAKATAEAEATRLKGESEGAAEKAHGEGVAAGIKAQAEAYNGMDNPYLLANRYIDIMPKVAEQVAKPLTAVDSIKMYGSGNAQKLVRETTSIVDQVASGLKDSTGIDLPSLLNGLISNPDIDADSAENSVE